MEKLFGSDSPLKAVRDFGCEFYYKDQIEEFELELGKIVNTGFLVLSRQLLKYTSYDALINLLEREGLSYDGSDQGYLNWYIQRVGIPHEELDVSMNYALDYHYPFRFKVPKIIHFTGPKPWLSRDVAMDRPLVDEFFYESAKRVMKHLRTEAGVFGLNRVRMTVRINLIIGWFIRMSYKTLGKFYRWTFGGLIQGLQEKRRKVPNN